MIIQFSNALLDNIVILGIDQDELIGMHTDTEVLIFDVLTHSTQGGGEMWPPVDGTDGMTGKGNGLGGDSKEIEAVFCVVFENLLQAVQVLFGHFQAFLVGVAR